MIIGDTQADTSESLDVTAPVPWTDYGFAPWVQPAVQRIRRNWLRPPLALGVLVGGYVVVFGWLTWLQQANFGTFDYDLGIFDQEIWLSAHHLNPFITIRGLNMWANHVNPITYLLVPFYWLGAGPHFLYLVQTVALAGAAVPLWLLARDRIGRPWLALAVPLAWLLYPSVEWMTWWHFHPEALGVPAFIFAYWFADRERWVWYGVCVAVVLMCKEDTAFVVMALGLLLVLRRHRRAGLVTMACGLSWFLVAGELIIPAASQAGAPFYLYRFSALGNSFPQIFWNSIRHPSRPWHLAVQGDRYRYYAQLFLPVAGLALLAPATLLLAVPTLLENVLNNQGYAHDIKYQYSAFVVAGIFLAVVEGLKNFRGRRLVAVVGVLCVVSLTSNAIWSPSPLDAKQYRSGIWTLSASARVTALADMVQMVPAGAGVSASYTVVPHLSHRDQIYTFPNPWVRSYYGATATEPPEYKSAVQYLVVDETEDSPANALLLDVLTARGGPFQVVMARDGALLARRVRPG